MFIYGSSVYACYLICSYEFVANCWEWNGMSDNDDTPVLVSILTYKVQTIAIMTEFDYITLHIEDWSNAKESYLL